MVVGGGINPKKGKDARRLLSDFRVLKDTLNVVVKY